MNNNLQEFFTMNKSTIIGSALIAAGLFLAGYCIKGGIDNLAYNNRQVTVRGLAERTVEADQVTWPMSYSIAGNNLTELYNTMTANNNTVVKFLTDNGISKDDITVNPPSLYNRDENYYGSNNGKYQYNLSISITVNTKDVDKVRELLDRQSELFTQGVALNTNYVNYEFTGLNEIKPEMIAEATKNARLAADQFAKDSDSKVGKINTAYQGQFSIEPADQSTPQIKNVRVVSTIVYYLED